MADKVLPQRVRVFGGWMHFDYSCLMLLITYFLLLALQIRDLVPESQAYMDLLAFERKLDQTIARKRMEIQEAIKKPIMVCLHDCTVSQKTITHHSDNRLSGFITVRISRVVMNSRF